MRVIQAGFLGALLALIAIVAALAADPLPPTAAAPQSGWVATLDGADD
jgi:hypothetical protein